MIVHDCQQNTKEWLDARCGIPTASQFSRILTPTGLVSTASKSYRNELIFDRFMGSIESEATAFMARGSEMEIEAVSWYELTRAVDTEAVGFVTDDEGVYGSSPDRLVGDNGGMEIKCLSGPNHVGILLGDLLADKHKPQVQGNLWVTEREWWDVVAFNPVMQTDAVRVERDELFIAKLAKSMSIFVEKLEEGWAKFLSRHEGLPVWWEDRKIA